MPCNKRALFLQIAMALPLVPNPCVWAVPPVPTDFAYGISLPVTDTTGLYVLDLPLAVYLQLQRDDQGDLQVFNGAGQPVPQALRRHDPPRIPVRQPIPFFPLEGEVESASQDLSIQIQRQSDGSLVTIQRNATAPSTTSGYSYLLDLSGCTSHPTELELTWQEESPHTMLSLAVFESNDLANWYPVRNKVVLAELAYNGGTVSQRSFALPGSIQPYLRLDCQNCRQPFKVTAVTALTGPQTQREQWQWQQLANEQVALDQEWWRIEYHNGAGFRVTALDLAFPQPNSLARVEIESRPNRDVPWRRIGKGDFYRLDLQGSLLNSPFLSCLPNSDRYWRLSVAATNALSTREQLPNLSLGWQADELVFLGRGPGPYTLAFGSNQIDEVDATQDALVLTALQQSENNSQLNRITAGPITQLAGTQALQAKTSPLPWQRILLWTVLVAGVGMLAVMARSVYREMQRKQE